MYGRMIYPPRYGRPRYGRPRYNVNYGFGVPFLLGVAAGSVFNPYYNPYYYNPYYY